MHWVQYKVVGNFESAADPAEAEEPDVDNNPAPPSPFYAKILVPCIHLRNTCSDFVGGIKNFFFGIPALVPCRGLPPRAELEKLASTLVFVGVIIGIFSLPSLMNDWYR